MVTDLIEALFLTPILHFGRYLIAAAVLAASIFHESTYTVAEVKRHLEDAGFAMRLEEQEKR